MRAVACCFSDFCVNLLIHAFLKFYLRKGNLGITANIIYLVRELYLGDCIGSFLMLERWVITALFIERHFSSVFWPLAGDVQRITCSFIALALNIHVFCLRAEAEGMQWKRFEECAQNLKFHVGGAKVSLWLHLHRKFVLQNVSRSEWVRSQKQH